MIWRNGIMRAVLLDHMESGLTYRYSITFQKLRYKRKVKHHWKIVYSENWEIE